MPIIEGSSNFTISGYARLYEIHGNAVLNHISNINELKKFLSVVNLPRAQASHKDYETWKKSGPCFPGTRQVLLQEIMDWVTGSGESKMYVLSGLAGIGKSTVVYTLATQAEERGLLGASFFFSRDDDSRNNAKRFFTTIAYQLCVYNDIFANAIGDVLLGERGSAATTQSPLEQLKVLILDPLQRIVWPCDLPVLVVVDALDECDEEDERAVAMGLTHLVRLLPSFKVILTTRPQPLVNYFFGAYNDHKIFRLQDIEDKIVDGDIRRYLSYSFSQEQVRRHLLNPEEKWCASEEDIESLVRAAGRLFIIAATAVFYVLNKSFGDPGARMKLLLSETAQDRTPLHALNHFYSIIARGAIQVDIDDNDMVDHYQTIVGTIVVLQTPLPVTALASLTGQKSETIYAMLRNLQSVISLGDDDVPRIYHKSFSDYLTDQTRCKEPHLRIDPRIHHMRMASRCFGVMNKRLKYNILGLGDPARFMTNEEGLKKDGITNEHLKERIPIQLRYACVYWINHLEVANIKDIDLMKGREQFIDKHLLHWLEALSLIGELYSAHRAILKFLVQFIFIQSAKQATDEDTQKLTSSDSHQLLYDILRFMGRFYQLIEQSALHTYHSALPFTPTESDLYRRYIKDSVHNIWTIEGGPEKWEALVAHQSHGEQVDVVKFSLDNTLYVSCTEEYAVSAGERGQGKLKIWDAITGTPISTIPCHRFAVANDFSVIASSEDNIITLYNVNGSARGTMFTTSSKIETLAFSSESNRIAAGLSDGTVLLWDNRKVEVINSFNEFEHSYPALLQFSPTGTRLAYSSKNRVVKLRDGISGRFIVNLPCGSCRSDSSFEFSDDGSRIASMIYCDSPNVKLTLWNSESGALMGAVECLSQSGRHMAISANGSLLATTDLEEVRLWKENRGHLIQTDVLELNSPGPMAFSVDDILAIATYNSFILLYNVKTNSIISTLGTLSSVGPKTLTFSPDCTRLALGTADGDVYLWDIRLGHIGAFSLALEKPATALALSRDGSRLVSGFADGTVDFVGGRTPANRRIGAMLVHLYRVFRKYHTDGVKVLAFSPDGRLFASGSYNGTTKLWNCRDGSLRGTLKVPGLRTIALSKSILVSAGINGVALWGLDTLRPIHTFGRYSNILHLAIADDNAFIAAASNITGYLLNVENHTTIMIFDIPYMVYTIAFLPDNSQLVVQSNDGNFLSLNLINRNITKLPTFGQLIQLPNIPLWCGVPIWHCMDGDQHYFSALFPQHKSPVPVLWIPWELEVCRWMQGSSTIAIMCYGGRVVLLRLATSHDN